MIRLTAVVLSILFVLGCDNEIELTTEWQDIPVIYGILNKNNPVNYVRVEKAFLDPNTNAFDLAKVPDSIYYQNVLVQLERPKRNELITLQRVNATEEGITRAEGIFATEPNILYKLDLPRSEQLENGEQVRIIVTRGEASTPAIATTTILNDFIIINGQPADLINWGEYERPVRISWRPEGEEATIYDVKFLINYDESTNNGEFLPKVVEWIIAQNFVREDFSSQRLGVEVLGQTFYSFLQSTLPTSSSVRRRFKSMDLQVIAGGQELLEYINLRNVNTGITSSQEIPTYTNVEGGLGVFTSINVAEKKGIQLTGPAIDSLKEGRITRNLNFVD
ncbi:MAG: DUF4249 family protein [Saprospiraceae bacterium]|nr:DUF4249 family protein [Saprospiraceae bacterium]